MGRLARFSFFGAWIFLGATIGLFFVGHRGIDPEHLDPFSKFISEYASSARLGGAISFSMVTFGIAAALVGLTVAASPGIAPKVTGALLIAAALCMPFVALWPTKRVPRPAHNLTEYVWQLVTLQGIRNRPSREDVSKASRHDATIGAAMTCIALSMAAMTLVGPPDRSRASKYRWSTAIALIFMALCFPLMKTNLLQLDGLWQRLCFGSVTLWLGVTLLVFRPRCPATTQTRF